MVRKTVTVVFAYLVGSTALGERIDPEVLQEALAVYERKGILPCVERTRRALADLGTPIESGH